MPSRRSAEPSRPRGSSPVTPRRQSSPRHAASVTARAPHAKAGSRGPSATSAAPASGPRGRAASTAPTSSARNRSASAAVPTSAGRRRAPTPVASDVAAPVESRATSAPPAVALSDPMAKDHVAILHSTFPFKGYIPETEHRGLCLQQLESVVDFVTQRCSSWRETGQYSRTAGQRLSTDTVNLYNVNTWVIRPATLATRSAFVELLSADRQTPAWFVSHWWGEPVSDFVRCIRGHIELRELPPNIAYWVCAYANRQHCLESELTPDPRSTSFYRAMKLATGILIILDGKKADSGPATPFKRIWCAFEASIALTDESREVRLLMDMAASHERKARLLTDGIVPTDLREGTANAVLLKAIRESNFPIEVINAGLAIKLEAAEATFETDRKHILNCLAGQALELEPLEEHPNYTRVDQCLRASFAVASWRQACRRRLVSELGLPRIVRADVDRRQLELNFSLSTDMDEEGLTLLAAGFPARLQELYLDFSCCPGVADDGITKLGVGLAPLRHLQRLRLDVVGCGDVGDRGLTALVTLLPDGLESLEIICGMSTSVSPALLRRITSSSEALRWKRELSTPPPTYSLASLERAESFSLCSCCRRARLAKVVPV